MGKYAQRPNVAKALFEYLFYHENSVREALDLAAQVDYSKLSLYRHILPLNI